LTGMIEPRGEDVNAEAGLAHISTQQLGKGWRKESAPGGIRTPDL